MQYQKVKRYIIYINYTFVKFEQKKINEVSITINDL